MARKKGRDISGWLIIDKPAGVGSTDVVGRVRWALDAKKAGHAGTLDPDATGILAVALGEATKTVPLLTEALKAYDFTVNWGAETDTDDASGTVTGQSDARPSADAIRAALPAFIGEIMQVPPAFSERNLQIESVLVKEHAAEPRTRADGGDRAGNVHDEQDHRRDD